MSCPVRSSRSVTSLLFELVGPLAAIVTGLTDGAVRSMYLIHDRRGQPFTLPALRKRFDDLGCDWQIRDLRAKAASDSTSSCAAQTLLGQAAATAAAI